MYAFDSGPHDAWVTLHRVGATGAASESYFVPVRRTCAPAECDAIPWYAELDLPVGAVDERVNVYVTMGIAETIPLATIGPARPRPRSCSRRRG